MSKNLLITILLVFVVGVFGVWYLLGQKPPESEITYQTLKLEEDLASLSLLPEELQVLANEGIKLPSGEDAATKNLLQIRASDAISSIEADLLATDLSGLDAELDQIAQDLSGL